MSKKYQYSVFTKPWKNLSMDKLGEFVKGLGFDGIEFPLRSGFQAEPDNAVKDLPKLVEKMDEYGLRVFSVAASTEENIFAACQAAGVPIIRIMVPINAEKGYMTAEKEMKLELDKCVKLCEKYGIKVGIQHHYGTYISNSMETRHLIESYDPEYIAAIWDAAHSGLAGEEPEFGLDILWSHLCMVNLKTAFYKQTNGPEAKEALWDRYFTTGRHGISSWSRITDYLKKRNYSGIICLPAEYTDEHKVDKYIKEDIMFVKSLLEG
jgi:sugar phosphate isomerase/epimerase